MLSIWESNVRMDWQTILCPLETDPPPPPPGCSVIGEYKCSCISDRQSLLWQRVDLFDTLRNNYRGVCRNHIDISHKICSWIHYILF